MFDIIDFMTDVDSFKPNIVSTSHNFQYQPVDHFNVTTD